MSKMRFGEILTLNITQRIEVLEIEFATYPIKINLLFGLLLSK